MPPKEQTSANPAMKAEEITDGLNKDTGSQTADKQAGEVSVLPASQSQNILAPVAEGGESSDTPATIDGPGKEPGKTEAPFITSGPTSIQSYVPTTSATFALNAEHAATLDEPMASNTNTKAIGDIDNPRPTYVANTSSDLSGPLTAAVGVPLASSPSVPPIVVEQGALNP